MTTPAMAACDVTTPTSVSVGSQSSAGLQTNATYVRTDGSFSCTSSAMLTLLNGDYLRATLASGTGLTLTGPGGTVPITLAADAAGTKPLTPGTTVAYQDGALLTLLDNSNMRPAIFVRAQSTGDLPAGTYSGTFTVRWAWSFCTQAGLAGLCALGKTDANAKNAQITITLTVTPKPAAVTIAYTTTWSPTSATSNPKAVPGAKVRIRTTISNPDTVALDANTLAVTLATPPTVRLALEGDGTATNASVDSAQGTKASGLTLTYASPGSTADDVDFSADGGATWTYVPVAGDAPSQAAVTTVRFRPRGVMTAGSSFVISLPYVVK
ncbi:MAG: protein CsuE [Methylobacterium sp.]|nr:MAG: protein CsuE [Methylobacterium sp.]